MSLPDLNPARSSAWIYEKKKGVSSKRSFLIKRIRRGFVNRFFFSKPSFLAKITERDVESSFPFQLTWSISSNGVYASVDILSYSDKPKVGVVVVVMVGDEWRVVGN